MKYDPDSKCSKCGAGNAGTSYAGIERFRLSGAIMYPERLIRTCNRCGYKWCEEPLDKKRKLEYGNK